MVRFEMGCYTILPFVVLKRFDCVMAETKWDVLDKYNEFKDRIDNLEHLLKWASKWLSFYNYSKYDFKTLLEDPDHIEENLFHYIDSFSGNVQNIFENFWIKVQIEKLAKANLLFKLVKKFNDSKMDLHPDVVDNHEMWVIFEELVRKFAEQSNEEAWEHFTPRDIIDLMTHLMFKEDKNEIQWEHIIKKIYDPACGTWWMLTNSRNYINESINSEAKLLLYWQEINPKTFAVAKSDMLLKWDNSDNVKWPFSTLWKDGFPDEKFDYIISNPPYGTKWEADKDEVLSEANSWNGWRFPAWTPRINDGQLLFLQHMISKMKVNGEKSRIAVITNGSPLFTWDAWSWESEIRKYIIENDYLEAIIALPWQLFYNTGITTYIWILTNQKKSERVWKVQLVNATDFWKKMRKSLWNKRRELDPIEHQQKIIDLYHNFEKNEYSQIFNNDEFAYTKVIVERPMQLNFQVSEERLENLYSISTFSKFSESKLKDEELKEAEEQAWIEKQNNIIEKLRTMLDDLFSDYDIFYKKIESTLEELDFKPTFIKQIVKALSKHDDNAPFIVDKKNRKQANWDLRDNEKIKLTENIEEYFKKEVIPYYPDAWIEEKIK